MKKIKGLFNIGLILSIGFILMQFSSPMENSQAESGAAAPDHSVWSAILQVNVSAQGNVNYTGIKADKRFEEYISTLSAVHPDESWTKNERMAFWINAYNAFTVKLITDNWPVKSIKDLGEPWDKKFIKIENATYSLGDIENEILRKKFDDPRIHFAINCASISCPKLLNKAFLSSSLNDQLEKVTKSFINDEKYNNTAGGHPKVSELFNWYKVDFTKDGSVIDYINKYADAQLAEGAHLHYMPYNWNLNK